MNINDIHPVAQYIMILFLVGVVFYAITYLVWVIANRATMRGFRERITKGTITGGWTSSLIEGLEFDIYISYEEGYINSAQLRQLRQLLPRLKEGDL